MEKYILNDREFSAALNALAKRTVQIDEIENPLSREMVEKMVKFMDLVHREGLGRLWAYLGAHHPDVQNALNEDFAIHELLLLYDLVFVEGNANVNIKSYPNE